MYALMCLNRVHNYALHACTHSPLLYGMLHHFKEGRGRGESAGEEGNVTFDKTPEHSEW